MLDENYNANKIKKPIISENKAIASVKAKPKIANLKSSSLKEGFLETPSTNAPNTVPIPTPAPAKPIVAKPAPINLAACNNIKLIFDLENLKIIKKYTNCRSYNYKFNY